MDIWNIVFFSTCLSFFLVYHLYYEVFAWHAVRESRVIVVVIKDGDEGCARSTTGRGTSILNHHYQLVARLLLPVQKSPCTDLTWGQKGVDDRDFMLRH